MGQSPQYHNHRTHGNCNYVWGAVVRLANGKVKTEKLKLFLRKAFIVFAFHRQKAVPTSSE